MLLKAIVAAVAASVALASPAAASARHEMPRGLAASLAFTGYVVDQAGVLDAGWRRRLTDRLGRFQRETKHQLAIVTVSSLSGQDVAAFTLALARRWGVGRKGVDDGVVILIAPNERKARIEIGRGLGTRLTNAFCTSVLKTKMIPAFGAGQFGKGIDDGVTAIIARLAATE